MADESTGHTGHPSPTVTRPSAHPGAFPPDGNARSPRPVRVLCVHSTLQIGGAEEVRLSLLSHLDRNRYDVTVCCLQCGGPIADELAALGYQVIVLKRRAHAFSLPTLMALRRLIRERRPHIVQTSLPRANYWGRIAAALERVPVVIAEEHSVFEKSDRARPLIERFLGPHTDCVIAVSDSVRDAVATMDRASARRRTVVITNPVNSARLRPRRSRTRVRWELGVTDSDVLVVHTGRLGRAPGAKGHDILIRAIAAVRAADTKVVCALLGDGPGRPQLESMAQKLNAADNLRFLGYRRDVADFLAAADVFAFPSRWEGKSLALMEAMWMGLPVVASDIPANRETLGGGEYGRLVEPGSSRALAAGIAELAVDARARAELGEKALRHARDNFGPEQHAREMTALWDSLLEAKSQ